MLSTVHALDRGRRVDLRLTLDALRNGLPLVDEGAPKAWIHVMSFGEWSGYYDYEAGDFVSFEFNDEVFDAVIANFVAQKNPIPLTYEHPDYPAAAAAGNAIPAAGWIHELEKREDGLWAYVEFTTKAADHVRAGEYRYCSIVLYWEGVDRRTGEEIGPYLAEVGLVNRPFIDGLTPIQLSRTNQVPRAMSPGKKEPLMASASDKILAIRNAFSIDPALSDQEAAWAVYDMMCALVSYKKAEEILSAPLGFAARAARGVARVGGPSKFGAARETMLSTLALAMVDVDKLKEALAAMPEQPTMEELVGVIDGLAEAETEDDDEDEEPTGEETSAADTDPKDKDLESMRAAALKSLGLAEDATDEDLFAAVTARAEDPEKSKPDGTVTATAVQLAQAKIAAGEKRAQAAEAVALAATQARDAAKLELAQMQLTHAKELAAFRVDLSIARGEIVPSEKISRDKLVELAATSPATYDLVVSGLEAVPVGTRTTTETSRTDRPLVNGGSKDSILDECRREVKAQHPDMKRTDVNKAALQLAKTRAPALFT